MYTRYAEEHTDTHSKNVFTLSVFTHHPVVLPLCEAILNFTRETEKRPDSRVLIITTMVILPNNYALHILPTRVERLLGNERFSPNPHRCKLPPFKTTSSVSAAEKLDHSGSGFKLPFSKSRRTTFPTLLPGSYLTTRGEGFLV